MFDQPEYTLHKRVSDNEVWVYEAVEIGATAEPGSDVWDSVYRKGRLLHISSVTTVVSEDATMMIGVKGLP